MHSQRSVAWLLLASTLILGVCGLLTLPLAAAPSPKPLTSTDIVISQIYGGGGNAGTTYKNDFIELFNRGTAAVDLSDWSVQYASASGSKWSVTTLSGTISAGNYYLVQEAQGAGGSSALPAPDAIGAIAISATSGKVALVNNQAPISNGTTCPSGASIVDLVGYGKANCSEGTPVPALNNTHAAIRSAGGCIDTDDNSSDFTTGAPEPRNSSSPANPCGTVDTPTDTATHTSTATRTETPTPTWTLVETNTPTGTPTDTSTSTATPTPTRSSIPNELFINEFLPHPVSDWNGDGVANTDDEWIELFNAANSDADLGGWKLDDVSNGGSAPYTIPGGVLIPARGFRVFFHAETGIALNDTGDDVQLLHADETTADAISYSSSDPDRSYGRFPDGDPFFTDDCPPSPGASNCSITPTVTPTPTPYPQGVLVNEFMPQPQSDWNHDGSKDSYDEWIELYSLSDQAIDLGGWKLDDTEGGSTPYFIPPGTTIDPHAFLVFYANQTGIGLNNDGDQARLLHPDGSVADEKSYVSSAPDRAYGRKPDGGDQWQTRCYATPGQPNCSIVLTPTPTAVYRLTDFADARTLLTGSRITVVGSVIAKPCQLDQYGHEMMLSDGMAGIDVYLPYPEQLTCAIGMGEQILATGVITDHYGLREIRLHSNNDVVRNYGPPREIAPLTIHTDNLDEEHESMLVTVQGRVVNGQGGDIIWVDDGEGAVEIEATPWSGASFAGITHGSIVRVTGVGYQYIRYSATNGGYRIRPRMPQDVIVVKLADKVPPAPGGWGKILGAVSIATTHTTHTGNYVLVGGVVTVPPGVIGSRDFWIQDVSGGVHVYVASSAGQVPGVGLWDNVTVRGRVVTYYGEREVRVEEPSSIHMFGVGPPIAPLRVQTGALTLKHEGTLVEVAGAITRAGGRDVYVNDGSGEALIYIDPDTHLKTPNLKIGDPLRVVGVVRRYDRRAEVVPRFPSDLSYEEEGGAGRESGSVDRKTGEVMPALATATPTLTASHSPTPTPNAQLAALAIQTTGDWSNCAHFPRGTESS